VVSIVSIEFKEPNLERACACLVEVGHVTDPPTHAKHCHASQTLITHLDRASQHDKARTTSQQPKDSVCADDHSTIDRENLVGGKTTPCTTHTRTHLVCAELRTILFISMNHGDQRHEKDAPEGGLHGLHTHAACGQRAPKRVHARGNDVATN
jgi:hypothetical protein